MLTRLESLLEFACEAEMSRFVDMCCALRAWYGLRYLPSSVVCSLARYCLLLMCFSKRKVSTMMLRLKGSVVVMNPVLRARPGKASCSMGWDVRRKNGES